MISSTTSAGQGEGLTIHRLKKSRNLKATPQDPDGSSGVRINRSASQGIPKEIQRWAIKVLGRRLTSIEGWRKNGSHKPKHTSSSVKHGGGTVMAEACVAASGTRSLIFIDDGTPDSSSWMNSGVYRTILSASLQRNASSLFGRIVQQENHPKHPVNKA